MNMFLLRKLKGQFVQIEYGHPFRASTANYYGWIFDLLDNEAEPVIIFLTRNEVASPAQIAPAVPGTAPTQSNMVPSLPTMDFMGQYSFLFLRPDGIVGMSLGAGITYRYDKNNTQVGSKFERPAENQIYPLLHANREQFEKVVRDALNADLVKLGLVTMTKLTGNFSPPSDAIAIQSGMAAGASGVVSVREEEPKPVPVGV